MPIARRANRSTPRWRPRTHRSRPTRLDALGALHHSAARLRSDRTAPRDELAATITAEAGFPIADAQNEVTRAIQTFLISAEEGKRLAGEVVPIEGAPGHAHRMAFTIRVPRGVVCGITSFNAPLNFVAHKAGPALASGNTVVAQGAAGDAVQRRAAVRRSCSTPGCRPGTSTSCRGRAAKSAAGWSRTSRFASTPSPAAPRSASSCIATVGLRPIALELGSIAATHRVRRRRSRSRRAARGEFRVPPRRAGLHLDAAAVRAPPRARAVSRAVRRGDRDAEGRRPARSRRPRSVR